MGICGIEEAIKILKDNIKSLEGNTPFKHTNYKKIQAIETLLTAYEKEKEKNNRYKELLIKVLALNSEISKEKEVFLDAFTRRK